MAYFFLLAVVKTVYGVEPFRVIIDSLRPTGLHPETQGISLGLLEAILKVIPIICIIFVYRATVKAIEKRKNRPIKTLDPKEAKPLSSLRTRN